MRKKFKLKGLPIKVSTTAIRYLKVALEIKENLIKKEPLDIVEIGCGYGGQACILNQIIEILESFIKKGEDIHIWVTLMTRNKDYCLYVRLIKPIEELVSVSFTHYCASTPDLSTW